MTYGELVKRVAELADEYSFDYVYIGIRFENKERTIGEVITDVSKANILREVEREFPEYGTDEYEELDDLNGVCAYNATSTIGWGTSSCDDLDAYLVFEQAHCYLIGSQTADYGEDENEIIMENAQVLEILF